MVKTLCPNSTSTANGNLAQKQIRLMHSYAPVRLIPPLTLITVGHSTVNRQPMSLSHRSQPPVWGRTINHLQTLVQCNILWPNQWDRLQRHCGRCCQDACNAHLRAIHIGKEATSRQNDECWKYPSSKTLLNKERLFLHCISHVALKCLCGWFTSLEPLSLDAPVAK